MRFDRNYLPDPVGYIKKKLIDVEYRLTNVNIDLGFGGSWVPIVNGGWFDVFGDRKYEAGGEFGDVMVPITKGSDGRFYADLGVVDNGNIIGDWNWRDLKDYCASMGMTADEWLKNGATKRGMQGYHPFLAPYDYFDEGFLVTADANNTIFSDVFSDGDIRDIKDQTLEGPGDTAHFIAYTYSNIINSDTFSEGNAVQMKLFWENYAGNTTGANAQALADPFGKNSTDKSPYTQDLVMSIYGIPQPEIFDMSRPFGASGTGGPAMAPEIEIIFKINQMDIAPSYNKFAVGGPFTEFARSFNIIGKATAPAGDERALADYVGVASDMFWVSFLNTGASLDGVDMIDVFANNIAVPLATPPGAGGNSGGHVYIETPANVTGTAYHTQVPSGKWLVGRIRFCYTSGSKGGPVMMYFPNEFDSDGEMRIIQIASYSDWGDIGEWYNHLTFWANNMRAINEVPDTSYSLHINNYYGLDSIINDDKQVDVLIDSINFLGWNTQVQNATVTPNNGTGRLLKIPTAYAIPSTINNSDDSGPVKISSGSSDNNIYGIPSVPIPTYLSIGYDAPSDWIPGVNYSNNASKTPANDALFTDGHNIMFNDFSVRNPETAKPVTLISGAHFNSTTYQRTNVASSERGNWFNPNGAYGTTVGTAESDNIRIGGFDNSVDSFTQKGLITISGTTTAGEGFSGWVRTGNPYVSARILNVEENGSVITVDNPSIFNLPADTNYVIEAIGDNPYASLWRGTGSMGYMGNTAGLEHGATTSGANNALTAVKLGDNRIRLNRGILGPDTNPASLEYNTTSKYFGLSQYRISPYKFWIVMEMINVSGAGATDWGEWWEYSGVGETYPQEPKYNTLISTMPTRTYSNIVAVSGGSIPGTTFNESTFTDGIYANRWTIDFFTPDDNVVNLGTNFGFGAITNDEDSSAVSSDGGVGYMGREFCVSGQNYINISNYVRAMKPKEGDDFNFLLKPTYTKDHQTRYTVNVNTDDATTDKLQVVYGLLVLPPPIEDFTVSPMINMEKIKDLTVDMESNAANVMFTWVEQNTDIWYRMLFVDDKNISNKYHNINFWAPLNETDSSFGYYTSQTDTSSTAFTNSGSLTSDIEGFMGYGAKFDGTDDYLIGGGASAFASGSSRWSFVAHCKPSAVDGTLIDVWDTTSQFKVDLSSSRVVVTEDGSSTTLTSTNIYDCDGKQPLAIIVTYDKNLNNNNWRLYVNGKLEDTQDYTSLISVSGTIFIGASGVTAVEGANPFAGYLEEITSHSGTAVTVPPNEKSYVFNTSPYNNVVSGTTTNASVFYTGRLFVMDYHNIRGKGARDVGRSNMASWKVTSI